MIIPVRCKTCGKVLADKWTHYARESKLIAEEAAVAVQAGKSADGDFYEDDRREKKGVDGVSAPVTTPHGRLLDKLGITSLCCRTVMMTHVDLHSII